MKKVFVAVVIISVLITGCSQPLNMGNKVYPTYGLFNEGSIKSRNVCYSLSVGNAVLSIILVETIIAPIYFIGFDLFEPIRMKKNGDDQCTIDD